MRAALVALCLLAAGCATSSTGGVETAASEAPPAPVVTSAAPVKPAAVPVKPKPAAPAAKTYGNCTELRKAYLGGVAKPGAVNRGEPLTMKPKQDAALYAANEGKDRDGDGLACES